MNIAAQITEETLRALGSLNYGAQAGDIRSRDLVISAATQVEIHVDRLLEIMIEASLMSETSFGKALLEEVGGSLHQNWANRHRWLKDAFHLDASSTSERHDLDTLVELRNALIHGGGSLTERQSQDMKKRIALEKRMSAKLDVHVARGGLYLGVQTGNLALIIARKYVVCLDRLMVSMPSSVLIASLR